MKFRLSVVTLIISAIILWGSVYPCLGQTIKSGAISSDETWSGEIYIKDAVFVDENVTLTILPGTIVKFEYYRGYRGDGRRGALYCNGGTISAIGTSDQPIWFTSSSDDPVNGDWAGIELSNTTDSVFQYTIIEFAILGMSQMESSATVSHSIIRWNNTEGLYAERSSPLFEYNTLYENGYHEIALEQYNTNVIIRSNVFTGGRAAIHTEMTSSSVEGNYFVEYLDECISAQAESTMTVSNNTFIDSPTVSVFSDAASTQVLSGNQFMTGEFEIPPFDYNDIRMHELDYVPGDLEDRFPYIYADEDETRFVTHKIGKGLGFGWAITWAKNTLWRFSFAQQTGEYPDFVMIDPETEQITQYRNDTIINPRGLTHDGQHFWTNDFSSLKIFQFDTQDSAIQILNSFDVPEKEKGGTNGLTSDGLYLYYHSRDGSRLFKLNLSGTIVETIDLQTKQTIIEGPFVWTGDSFWAVGKRGIAKYSSDWQFIGDIYPAAEGTWAIDWDGTALWTIQRTCEAWNEPKVYRIIPLLNNPVLNPSWKQF